MPFCLYQTVECGFCANPQVAHVFKEAPEEVSGIGIDNVAVEILVNLGWKLEILPASQNPKQEPELTCLGDPTCVGRSAMD